MISVNQQHPNHDEYIKLLKDNLDNKCAIVLGQGMMITNLSKYCETTLRLIRETNSERQYRIAMHHTKWLKRALIIKNRKNGKTV